LRKIHRPPPEIVTTSTTMLTAVALSAALLVFPGSGEALRVAGGSSSRMAMSTAASSSAAAAVKTTAPPSKADADILVRAYKGEKVERTPVWLMRQAGRYMADFRQYSEKYPFRQRSETPEIAIELSLQPWRSFGVDGVIMFSDILTPLPALGVDFTIVEKKGPKILNPLQSRADIEALKPMHDVATQVPFLGPILTALRRETEGKTSLIGFIGAPWTLVRVCCFYDGWRRAHDPSLTSFSIAPLLPRRAQAAYSVEGGHSKLCPTIKKMCLEDPALAHALLRWALH